MGTLRIARLHIPHTERNFATSHNHHIILRRVVFAIEDGFVQADVLQDFVNKTSREGRLARVVIANASFEIGGQPDSHIRGLGIDG